MQNFKSSFQMW